MVQPFISICVPVYNGETYLRECLDSCFSQHYSNYEVVVCDDGSTDGSFGLINEYQTRFAKLRVYRNDNNLGLVGNWNRCLDLAKGEWIKFVFQDDYLEANALNRYVRYIKPETRLLVSRRNFIVPQTASENVKNYYTNVVRTLENTCPQDSTHYSAKRISRAAMKHPVMNFIAEPSLTLFRKDLLSECGAFNPWLKQICDLEFLLRVASRFGLEYVPETLCAFRIHNASATSSNVQNKHFELRFIEPMVYSGLLLFAPEFKAFRSHLGIFERLKLRVYFELKAYRASAENKKGNWDHPVFRAKLPFKEALEKAARGNWLLNLLDRLMQRPHG